MAGSPRSLVCGRCAAWWGFARATCPHCGEEDPRKIAAHIVEGRRGVRIDVCETCNAYVKTFDLRVEGSRDVVPLVDDIASLSLDLWATTKGYRRRTVSLAAPKRSASSRSVGRARPSGRPSTSPVSCMRTA
jgi:FdhE protein